MKFCIYQINLDDSLKVSLIQKAVEQEMLRENPSEELIVSLIGDMASQIYSESTSTEMIASKMLWKSVQTMRPSDTFDCAAFSALAETVTLHQDGAVTLNTKTCLISVRSLKSLLPREQCWSHASACRQRREQKMVEVASDSCRIQNSRSNNESNMLEKLDQIKDGDEIDENDPPRRLWRFPRQMG